MTRIAPLPDLARRAIETWNDDTMNAMLTHDRILYVGAYLAAELAAEDHVTDAHAALEGLSRRDLEAIALRAAILEHRRDPHPDHPDGLPGDWLTDLSDTQRHDPWASRHPTYWGKLNMRRRSRALTDRKPR